MCKIPGILTYVIPTYVIPTYVILTYVIPTYVIPTYVFLTYIIPTYVIPTYVILTYVIPTYVPRSVHPSYNVVAGRGFLASVKQCSVIIEKVSLFSTAKLIKVIF